VLVRNIPVQSVCDHCGCRGVDAIRELVDEHTALVDASYGVRQAAQSGDVPEAMTLAFEAVGYAKLTGRVGGVHARAFSASSRGRP
jgi:hypothetical protein